jgi:hypothetical protein
LRSFLFIWVLLASLPLFPQESDQIISCHLENVSFDEFREFVKSNSGRDIFCKPEWVKDITVNLDTDSISVLNALIYILRGTGLEISEWNNSYILLPEERLIAELPGFSLQAEKPDSSGRDVRGTGSRFLTSRSSDVIKVITIGQRNAAQAGLVEIEGKISDLENGEPIAGATMYIIETRTGNVTDLQGNLRTSLRPGKYTARFECMGYKKLTCQLNVNAGGSFHVDLARDFIPIGEAVIYGDRQMIITSKDPGIEKIAVKSIKEIPMMLGERDILKVSEMLPGIVSIGEGSSGLNVRGGNFDQNAFYLNHVPVYNTSHFFGFFPAFNADVINDFTIYKGHVPAQFGGKLSSVFDIETRQGTRDRFSLQGGINPVSANLTISGPLISDSCTYLISGRTSYSDWILTRIDDYLIRNSSAGFYDMTASLTYDFKKTNVNLFFYHSSDRFKLADLSSYEYANLGSSLNINHRINSSMRNHFSLIGSGYSYGTTDQQEISTAYRHSYHLQHFELQNDITHTLKQNHTLNYGIDLTFYRLNRGTLEPYGPESLKSPVPHGIEQGMSGALYVSDMYDILPWLKLSAGFRFSLYSYLGPGEVFLYQQEDHRDIRLITDTLEFNPGAIIKSYSSPEIRIALNMITDPNGSVKLSFNQMQQPLFMLSNTIALAPNTQWKLSDYHLKPSRGNQYSAGIFRTFFDRRLEGSIEAFYKLARDFPEFRDGANFLSNPVVETDVLQGVQKSYGIEFFLKLNARKMDGWIAYTYSRSLITVDGNDIWNRINRGQTYPSNYDIPHALNTLFNYHFSKRVTISSVVTYQTGRPITYPVSVYYIEDQPYVDYSGRNKYRIPDYFRADLSLNIEGNLRKNKLIHSSWQFSLYNLTGRANAYSVYFISDNGKLKSYKYSIIGTQLFTISWLFRIGNIASG